MINYEQLLVRLVNELPLSEFKQACENAGINESLQQFILDYVSES